MMPLPPRRAILHAFLCPSFPAGSHDPLHVADPRAGAPRYPVACSRWAEVRGWGGEGTRAGQKMWVCLTSATYEDPGGDPEGAVTLQQAQYFQQSRSSSAKSSSRKMSRGMSHQKEPGGQSGKETGRGGEGYAHSPLRV